MNRKLRFGLLPLLATAIFTTSSVMAQGVANVPGKTLGHAVLYMCIFAFVGIVVIFAGFKIFDWLTPQIDIQKELLKNNTSVAIVTGSVLIALSIIVAVSML